MTAIIYQPLLIIFQLIAVYFASRFTKDELFYFFRSFIKKEKVVFALVSIFFLPGTILHELSHFFAATVLMIKVHEVSVIPKLEKNYIKLGSVLYEKKDFVRGILIGLAPVSGAAFFFFILSGFKLFPSSNLVLTIIYTYLIFTVSSTMFSSQQDLQDLIYIIPLITIIFGVIYILHINISFAIPTTFINGVLVFLAQINFYLLVSLAINFGLILLFGALRFIIKK